MDPTYGDLIDDIRICEYEFITHPGKRAVGVLAQELYEVCPDAVFRGDSGASIKTAWGVDYSKLVPLLIREVQNLRARVTALES